MKLQEVELEVAFILPMAAIMNYKFELSLICQEFCAINNVGVIP